MFLFQDRRGRVARRAPTRPMTVEPLEGRLVLSTFTVTNVNDGGAGSLRQAIISSNATTGGPTNTIDFSIGKSGVVETIALKSALPGLTHPVIIDGASEPGSTSVPLVVVSGTGAGPDAAGFAFEGTASGSTLDGVAVVGFSGDGVLISGASGVSISGDDIGTPNGTSAAGDGVGLAVANGLKNLIVNDTISGNSGDGVDLVMTSGDVIRGDKIGTNAGGNAGLGNGGFGILVDDSSGDTIGGPGAGDTISANGIQGVRIEGSFATKNVVAGDFIGTDAKGQVALGNGTDPTHEHSGVLILDGASGNTIGGTTASARDVISGNGYDGVHIWPDTNGNTVEGDSIGTDATGTIHLGNGQVGVGIDPGSAGNIIGVAGAGNTIAFNFASGVWLDDVGANTLVEYDLIVGNGFGTTSLALANMGRDGVRVDGSPSTTVIKACTIESNHDWGIYLNSSPKVQTSGNTIPTTKSLANGLGTIGS